MIATMATRKKSGNLTSKRRSTFFVRRSDTDVEKMHLVRGGEGSQRENRQFCASPSPIPRTELGQHNE